MSCRPGGARSLLPLVVAALAGGCGLFTDGATRIAGAIVANVGRLPAAEGAVATLAATPAGYGACDGRFKAQFDRVGALIVWCYDAAGQTVSSHSTSVHARYVDTAATLIVDKPAGAALAITLERRQGRAVIVTVQ